MHFAQACPVIIIGVMCDVVYLFMGDLSCDVTLLALRGPPASYKYM